ncbi:MAG: ATP-binding protein [Bacteriovoracaceae bacterium]|jgi:signal transduction histidine kinase|nr:ATP-binding protein [Bacteriovoracaceae bacterium]
MKISTFSRNYLKRTKRAYILFFGLILFLSLLAQIVLQYFIHQNKSNSHAINIAGRQRMLSQKILAYSLELQLFNSKKIKNSLLKSLIEIEENHNDLIYGNTRRKIPASFNQVIKSELKKLEKKLNELIEMSNCLLDFCRKDKEQLEKISFIARDYLEDMNRIVYYMSNYAQRETLFLSHLEFFFFLLIVIAMFFELKFIIFPFNRRLSVDIERHMSLVEKQQRIYQLAEVGQMTSEIIHEVNNFVFIIYGTNQILIRKGKENKELKEILPFTDKIELGANKIINLCRSMSSLSRINSISNFNISEIKDELEGLLNETLKKHLISFQFTIESDLKIRSSKGQIIQVLFNLIKNSIHALEEVEEKNIILTLFRDNKIISFIIEDSGLGITEDNAEKIFSPYFTTKEEGKGTGLGLSLSKKIAIALGGDLTYEKGKKGARFIFSVEDQ